MVTWLHGYMALLAGVSLPLSSRGIDNAPEIRTPKTPATPRINGPAVFGVRPGHPFLYTIPVTGDRPITFAVDRLPAGLRVDTKSGQIRGELDKAGEYTVTLRARNPKGSDKKKFRIV